ncbi:MAG: hypothetical protein HXX13_18025 [Bacteroidetes bacterium]|nr:hypothetical protein [Bacteroidota bacterium]
MKNYLFCTLLFLVFFAGYQDVYAQQSLVDKVRVQFFSMKANKDGALNLYFRLKPMDLTANSILLAYRGAASAASAGSVGGVYKKLEYFSNGKKEIELAVHKSPDDPEIRFLRLATQLNAPSFLGYHSNIEEDKNHIISSLAKLKGNDPNAYLYRNISAFLLDNKLLNAVEKLKISQFLKEQV